MKNFLSLAFGVLFFCVQTSYCHALPVERIPIIIDDPSGLTEIWPLTCGVPFPKGKLKDTSSLCLEDAAGKRVPGQIDVTATWLEDKSVRWVLVNFQGNPGKKYFLKISDKGGLTSPSEGIKVTEQSDKLIVNTGSAEFVIEKHNGLISQATINGRVLLKDSGSGAYVVDNQGRRARLGGRESGMETSFRIKGPAWTVVRKEGWYLTDKNERIARGIVWMHFYGNSPYVKVVHRLVLTEDTNKVWFKDIGIDFNTGFKGSTKATFDTAKEISTSVTTLPMLPGEKAWMLQDDFPHFMNSGSHFALTHQQKSGVMTEITTGKACGDWCNLSGRSGGLTVVLRNFAEQFPKEFTVSREKITVHLWAGRCGRELDFRTKTLIKEYWGKWCDSARLPLEEFASIPSNAIASAKTHTIWLLPHAGQIDTDKMTKRAHAAAERVLTTADPKWICSVPGIVAAPMLHKDLKKFPKEEAYISDFFDRLMYRNKEFPHTGYIAWGKCPNIRSHSWWRISNAIDYHMRRNTWTLYARSGERKYFEFGEHFNRFMGDMCTHHWDIPNDPNITRESQWFDIVSQGTQRVRGGWADGAISKDIDRKGQEPGNIPLYWRWSSGKIGGGSGVDMVNYLLHFYFTGDWDIWELAEDYGESMKKWDFLKTLKPHRGVIELRCITALYSMKWDKQFGDMARTLAHQFIDLESPCGIYEEMEPSPLYKTGRNLVSLWDYYRLTGDELAKKAFVKIVDYKFRFLMHVSPLAYQNAMGMENVMAYRFTGDDKYMSIVNLSNNIAMGTFTSTLDEDLALPAEKKKGKMIAYTMSFNYHACLSTPVMLKAMSEYNKPLKPFPLLRKNYESTKHAWAVFNKESKKDVTLEILFAVLQEDDLKPVVLGPDLAPVKEIRIVEKQKGIENPYSPGHKDFYIKLEIPKHLPAGDYRVGHANPGGFTVSNANVDKIVLECPKGFWLGKIGLESPGAFYFKVPDGLEAVKLFVNSPVTITRKNGLVANDISGKSYGELTLPVESRKPGFWKIHSKHTAFVRFRNLPPVAAYLTPDRFFVPEKLVQVKEEKTVPPDPGKRFPDGVIGEGLQLRGKNTLGFERGETLADGSYRNFPGHKGTIEFWFRPNWTAVNLSVPKAKDYGRMLLSAGTINIRYHYGQRSYMKRPENNLVFRCGKSIKEEKKNRYKKFGNHARIYPEAGQWQHIAVTWDTSITTKESLKTRYKRENYKRGKCDLFFVFVNGKRHSRTTMFAAWPIYLHLGRKFAEDYELTNIPEWIELKGTAGGTFDELRVSDVVRYREDFKPPTEPFTQDKNTKALFHFDGNLEGIGGDGRKMVGKHK